MPVEVLLNMTRYLISSDLSDIPYLRLTFHHCFGCPNGRRIIRHSYLGDTWIFPRRQNRFHPCDGIVSRDTTYGHDRAKRIKEILPKCRTRNLCLNPFYRARVPLLPVNLLVRIWAFHSPDSDLRGQFAWKDDKIVGLYTLSKSP